MTRIVLEHTEADARTVIKAAFEETDGIEKYFEGDDQVVGKTGWRALSYGETVIVDLSEDSDSVTRTPIEITAEKEVAINVTATPQKYKRRLIGNIENLRKYDADEGLAALAGAKALSSTNEVQTRSELPGKEALKSTLIVLAVMFLTFIMASLIG